MHKILKIVKWIEKEEKKFLSVSEEDSSIFSQFILSMKIIFLSAYQRSSIWNDFSPWFPIHSARALCSFNFHRKRTKYHHESCSNHNCHFLMLSVSLVRKIVSLSTYNLVLCVFWVFFVCGNLVNRSWLLFVFLTLSHNNSHVRYFSLKFFSSFFTTFFRDV